MRHHLWQSKELWNQMLETIKNRYESDKKFPTKKELRELVKKKGLYSQVAQELVDRLLDAVKKKVQAKKKGVKCGFPRFKPFNRLKSLVYPQSGFRLESKLKVIPFGEVSIKKHRDIDGQIKTLILKRESSGRWFAIIVAETRKQESKQNMGQKVGIDLGLINFATISDGTVVKNPHHLNKWQEKLAGFQRQLSRKEKGGSNRNKMRVIVSRLHEKVANIRANFLHKLSHKLVNSYSFIALEKLGSQEMAMDGHGKGINDAGWGMFANMLRYKAGSADCEIVFVNPKNTSKECNGCGAIVNKTLWDRVHNCPKCGLRMDRDLNASLNILKRATVGSTESNACGDGTEVPSLKQEAHLLRESSRSNIYR